MPCGTETEVENWLVPGSSGLVFSGFVNAGRKGLE